MQSKPTVSRVCPTCDETFYTFPSQIADGKGKYCSKGCMATAFRERGTIEHPCEHCGAPMRVYRSAVAKGHGRFCSRACAGTAARTGKSPAVCATCGKEFLAWPFRIRAGHPLYCSVPCHLSVVHQENRGKHKVETQCARCAAPLEVWPYRLRDRSAIYCSKRCSQSKGETRVCAVCAEEFYVSRSRIQEGARLGYESGKYCSIACASYARIVPAEQSARPRACRRYRDWRTLVLERDGHMCQRCHNTNPPLHAHHLVPWHVEPLSWYDPDNGLTVCPPCHYAIHGRDGELPNPNR